MEPASDHYSRLLSSFLVSHGIWHRFIEFDEPVKTVEQAAQRVNIDQIAKSIVLVDSNNSPLMVIMPAKTMISYKKVKSLLSVKDVRLATEQEVLIHSGYPVGGVPPFNRLTRAFMDTEVLKNANMIAGGGDVTKLVELHTQDVVDILKPVVTDLSR